MEVLIYIGIAINIIGAVYLMINAIKYGRAFKDNERLTPRMEALKREWARKRAIGFGGIIGGSIIAVIGCFI